MNKTVNINIGGLFFHIDEDAYQKLSRYFDAIKRSLTNATGKDEIMKDIEMRVAEIFSDRQKSDKHVINLKDVDEVVAVMGQPEDYRIEEETDAQPFAQSTSKIKKLYRDKDKGTIAGVCTGLGHYLGVDAFWIKLFLIIITLAGFGVGVVAYIILWAIIPKAVTTSEKLEMTGEPVNITSIKNKVSEEFENVSEKIKNVDYDKVGNQLKATSETAGNKIGNVLIAIFGAFAKVLGAIILVISAILLLGVSIGSLLLIFSSSLPTYALMNHISTPFDFDTPYWLQGIVFLLVFGIPLFFLVILGLKLLITNLKSIGNPLKYSLLGIWVIALSFLIFLAIKETSKIAYDGKSVQKEILNLKDNDTLLVKFATNDFYSKDIDEKTDYKYTQDEKGNAVIYSNDISLKILKTDEKVPYLQIEKLSVGNSPVEAQKKAEKIQYKFKFEGNKLVLDNYFLSQVTNRFKNKNVELFLYLPKGVVFKADGSVKNYDDSDNEYFNLHYSSSDYIYKVEDTKIKCLNCPVSENDFNDVYTEDISIITDDTSTTKITKINGVVTTEEKMGNEGGRLILNEDGVLIKSNEKNIKSDKIKSIKIDQNGLEIKTN